MTVSKENHYAVCLKRCVCHSAASEPTFALLPAIGPAAPPLLEDFNHVFLAAELKEQLAVAQAENAALRDENARWVARIKLLEQRLETIHSVALGRVPRAVQSALDRLPGILSGGD